MPLKNLIRWSYFSDEATVLFYSHSKKGLYLFDLLKPDSKPVRWNSDTDYNVNPDLMHTFIWLTYNPETENAILMHHIDEGKIRVYLISKGAVPTMICEIEMKNINWILKEKDRCYIACNTDSKNFPIYMINEQGIFFTI